MRRVFIAWLQNTSRWLLAAIFCLGFATAAPKLYHVELIVFTTLNAQALRSEDWPAVPSQHYQWLNPLVYPNLLLAGLRMPSLLGPQPYHVLPSNLLNKITNKLINNTYYHVLMHVSWLMPLTPKPTPVYVYAGRLFNADGQEVSRPADTPGRWEVRGLIWFRLQRFLNLHVNLLLSEPISTLNTLAPGVTFNNVSHGLASFQLLQSRRMNFRELDYIDYPVFGVLIKVTPRAST